MTRIAIIALIVALPTMASAQGVNQTSNPPTTVAQQRQNGAIVGPGSPTRTLPPANTFGSPFTSPFGPTTLPTNGRSGYAGSGPR